MRTGLFGLLGDALVQVVDTSQEARIEVFLKLAEACERDLPGAVPQGFSRETFASTKETLRRRVMDLYHDEELTTRMHPSIMFRLCTNSCSSHES